MPERSVSPFAIASAPILAPAVILGILVTLAVLPAGRAQSQSASSGSHITHYAIRASLAPATHTLTASARVDFVPESDLLNMNLGLASSLHVQRVVDAAGHDVTFHQEGPTLSLAFSPAAPAQKPGSVTVDYSGALATAEGSPVEDLKLAYVGPEGSYLLYPGRWFPVSDDHRTPLQREHVDHRALRRDGDRFGQAVARRSERGFRHVHTSTTPGAPFPARLLPASMRCYRRRPWAPTSPFT